jgi:hypothetical protein
MIKKEFIHTVVPRGVIQNHENSNVRNIGQGKDRHGKRKLFKRSFMVWNITPCSLLKVNGFLQGKCRRHLKDGGINQGSDQHEAGKKWSSFMPIRAFRHRNFTFIMCMLKKVKRKKVIPVTGLKAHRM